jgi:hypothetical protein
VLLQQSVDDIGIALPMRRPCQVVFKCERHDFPDADGAQTEFDAAAQILEPGLRNRLKSDLVALPANECDKGLLDVESGAVALTIEIERKQQHIALCAGPRYMVLYAASAG